MAKLIKNIAQVLIAQVATQEVAQEVAQEVTVLEVAAPLVIATVYIVDAGGNLYTCKLKEFAEVSSEVSKLQYLTVLKHNPTNVYGSGLARRSDEARRPLYLLQDGVMILQDMIATPVKGAKAATAPKAAKTSTGSPRTFYIVTDAADTRPFSVNAEQFEALSKDPAGLSFMSRLKHNPTCVSFSLTLGLISNDENRPMYRLTDGALTLYSQAAPAAETVAETVAEEATVAEETHETVLAPEAVSNKPLSKREMRAKADAAKAAKTLQA